MTFPADTPNFDGISGSLNKLSSSFQQMEIWLSDFKSFLPKGFQV
jgi:hypothetical protein